MKHFKELLKRRYHGRIFASFFAVVMFLNILPPVTWAGPEGAQVIHGDVSIQQSSNSTTITASDKAIVNYSSFDIRQSETVQFIQPSNSATVLNRILSASPTNIDGTLLANGRVFFVNPAGIYIGAGATINVNQLVASGLNISDSDFINGRYNFVGGSGSVINSGDIVAEEVYLIGKQVTNSGNISCPAGYVVMASGDRVFLGEPGSEIVLEIDESSLSESTNAENSGTGVLNEGTIEAAGGIITLAAAGDIYSQAISNVGTISASVETGNAGNVKFTATQGTVINSGSIEATSSSGTGGIVQILGDRIGLFDTGRIDVSGSDGGGTVLVGGDYQGKGDVPTASRTYIGSDSSIIADATENGDGGKVIVWGNEIARFYGDISARGGAEAGDGGFVEVSGKESLGFYGYVDTRAPQGKVGTLLLDPDELNITAAIGTDNGELASPGDPTIVFADDPGSDGIIDITAAHLVSELNLSDITLQANTQIDVEAAVNASGNANSHTLELDSPTINFSDGADITLNDAALTIRNTQSGDVDVVLLNGATVSLSTGAGAGDITIGGTVNGTAGSGAENLTLIAGNGNIDLQGAVGAVIPLASMSASASGINTQAVTTTGEQVYNGAMTQTGDVTYTGVDTDADGEGVNFDSTVDGGGFDVTISGGAGFASAVSNVGSLSADHIDTESTVSSGTVTVSGTSEIGGAVLTTGEQVYNGAVTQTGNVTYTGVDTDADGEGVNFGSTVVGGGFDMTISGGAGFASAVSNVGSLSADHIDTESTVSSGTVTVSGTSEIGGAVLATGNQVYSGAVTSEGDLALESTGGGITAGVINMSVDDQTFSLTQNDPIDMANFSVTNDEDTDLIVNSTGGSVTSAAADEWQSIRATAKHNIELSGDGNIQIASAGLSSTSGGVKVVSTGGTISTPGTGGILDAPITGYSDTSGSGVDLPNGTGKAAIVIMSPSQDLTLGANATLTANGIYSLGVDDRESVWFDASGSDAGDPIDVAIYLGTYEPGPTNAPVEPYHNVAIDSKISIADYGTMVIDADETVTFGSAFGGGSSPPNQTTRLEVVSRISQTLDEVIKYSRLPYAHYPGLISTRFLGTYVLRGDTLFAEILASVDAVPWAVPRPLEPEISSEVEGPDTEALEELLNELGIGVQPYVTEAYAASLNTDLRLFSAAEKLQQLIPILEDTEGIRVAGLRKATKQFFPSLDTLSEEQVSSFTEVLMSHKGDGTDYDAAGQCIFALTEYVTILGNDIGWPADKSIGFVMSRYTPRLTEGDEIRIAVIQMQLQKAFGI